MSADPRQRILAAAAEVFAARGLDATLAEIAERADVGVATVYRRFANKDELITELFAERLAHWERKAREAADAQDPWEGFVRYLEESTDDLAHDRGLRELVLGAYTASAGWARGNTTDQLGEMFTRTEAAMRVHHARLVHRAQEAGALRNDITPTDMLLLTMAIHSTLQLSAASRRPDIFRRVLGIVLDGLQPARSAPSPLPVEPLSDADLSPQ